MIIMFGNSIYVSDIEDDIILNKDSDIYFTSFHIAEEFNDSFKDKAIRLLEALKRNNKKVIADLSPRGLKALGYDSLEKLVKDYCIDYIRFDFGFSEEEIIEASNYCGIVVNASTIEPSFVKRLKGDVIAIHNYYPRKETGLDWDYFRERNKELKALGIKTGAFIAGDEKKRGPLFEGLPTLEEHRLLKPYVQYCQLRDEVDLILTGDSGLSEYQQKLITESEKNDAIMLPVYINKEYEYLYGKLFTNRPDAPFWLVRVKESREYASAGEKIPAKSYALPRNRGTITIDNEKYLRYSGEIQIMKEDFEADERVNVIGHINEGYENILECISRGKKFIFTK